MEKVTLDVETVTPLFIAGADQRNIKSEGLRASSLRGLMRWWFRAILGGVMFSSGSLNIKEIKEKEERIWGSPNEKSKVAINVLNTHVDIKFLQNIRNKRGMYYLAYGVLNRPYIEGKFKINFLFNSNIHEEDKRKVIATFWLLLNLGGIGSRNRRGFGSLRIINNTKIYGIDFRNPNNLNELEIYLKSNIKECLKSFGWNGFANISTNLPIFPIITRNFWKMKILNKSYSTNINAIDDIGTIIRQYREDRDNPSAKHRRKGYIYWVTKDYTAVKNIYTSRPPKTPPGSIFGLPHQFQFQSINEKAIVKGIKHDRRASPLHIKIWKLDERKFIVGLQLFKAIFLPENKLQISDLRNEKIKANVNLPSYGYIEEFLDSLSGRWILL